jgi:hypothetical protein
MPSHFCAYDGEKELLRKHFGSTKCASILHNTPRKTQCSLQCTGGISHKHQYRRAGALWRWGKLRIESRARHVTGCMRWRGDESSVVHPWRLAALWQFNKQACWHLGIRTKHVTLSTRDVRRDVRRNLLQEIMQHGNDSCKNPPTVSAGKFASARWRKK